MDSDLSDWVRRASARWGRHDQRVCVLSCTGIPVLSLENWTTDGTRTMVKEWNKNKNNNDVLAVKKRKFKKKENMERKWRDEGNQRRWCGIMFRDILNPHAWS